MHLHTALLVCGEPGSLLGAAHLWDWWGRDETLSCSSAKGEVRKLEQLREKAKWSLEMNSAELEHYTKQEKVPKICGQGMPVDLGGWGTKWSAKVESLWRGFDSLRGSWVVTRWSRTGYLGVIALEDEAPVWSVRNHGMGEMQRYAVMQDGSVREMFGREASVG